MILMDKIAVLVFTFLLGMVTMNFLLDRKTKILNWLDQKSIATNMVQEEPNIQLKSKKNIFKIQSFLLFAVLCFFSIYTLTIKSFDDSSDSGKLLVQSFSNDLKKVVVQDYKNKLVTFETFDFKFDDTVEIPYLYESFGVSCKKDIFGNRLNEKATKSTFVVMSTIDYELLKNFNKDNYIDLKKLANKN